MTTQDKIKKFLDILNNNKMKCICNGSGTLKINRIALSGDLITDTFICPCQRSKLVQNINPVLSMCTDRYIELPAVGMDNRKNILVNNTGLVDFLLQVKYYAMIQELLSNPLHIYHSPDLIKNFFSESKSNTLTSLYKAPFLVLLLGTKQKNTILADLILDLIQVRVGDSSCATWLFCRGKLSECEYEVSSELMSIVQDNFKIISLGESGKITGQTKTKTAAATFGR